MPECCKQVSYLSLEPKLCQSFSMLHGNNFDAIILLPRFNRNLKTILQQYQTIFPLGEK